MFSFTKVLKSIFSQVAGWEQSFFPETSKGKAPDQTKQKFLPPDILLEPRWVHVVSTYLRSVRYTPSTRKLQVNYLGKKTCTYSNIPQTTYFSLINYKGSKGQWARTHLFSLPYD